MKRGVLVIALALLFGSTSMVSGMAVEPDELAFTQEAQGPRLVEKEFRVPMGKRLDVDLDTGGALDITGWDNELVSVKAALGGRDGKDCEVEFAETPSGVRIRSRYVGKERNYSTDLRFEIKVPRRFDLKIESMGGSIKITNLEGVIRGQTMGGELELSDLKGEVRLRTMGGEVSLKASNVNGEVETMGGQVLIEDVTGDVKGSSMGGSVVYKNVSRGEPVGATDDAVRITSMGGPIRVDEALAGADVSTMGGEISIRSAAKFVKAKTMGGDIQVGAIDGWVQATTMSGDVQITMVGDPGQGKRDVNIVSYKGDITLTVPAGLSMDVEIELAYTKNSSQNFRIVSDFDLQQRVSEGWFYEEGTPRKYIFGTGRLGGGQNKIKIKTVNGNVYLKRG